MSRKTRLGAFANRQDFYKGELRIDAPEIEKQRTLLILRFPLDYDMEHADVQSLKRLNSGSR